MKWLMTFKNNPDGKTLMMMRVPRPLSRSHHAAPIGRFGLGRIAGMLSLMTWLLLPIGTASAEGIMVGLADDRRITAFDSTDCGPDSSYSVVPETPFSHFIDSERGVYQDSVFSPSELSGGGSWTWMPAARCLCSACALRTWRRRPSRRSRRRRSKRPTSAPPTTPTHPRGALLAPLTASSLAVRCTTAARERAAEATSSLEAECETAARARAAKRRARRSWPRRRGSERPNNATPTGRSQAKVWWRRRKPPTDFILVLPLTPRAAVQPAIRGASTPGVPDCPSILPPRDLGQRRPPIPSTANAKRHENR